MNISIKNLSIIIFFISIFTVSLSYFFSLYLNFVPKCFPPIDGCTSISRTGRYFPVNYFFKFFLFLNGFLIIFYWLKNYYLLKNNKNQLLINYSVIFGILSIFFFFLYLIFLGENGYYKFFRKVGIFIYLIFSILSELMLSIIYFLIKNNNKLFNIFFIKMKFLLSIFIFISGICLFPFMVMKIENVGEIRNIISWNFFFLIQLNVFLTSLIWKK